MVLGSASNILEKGLAQFHALKKKPAFQLITAQSVVTIVLFIVDVAFARSFSKTEFASWKHLLLITNLAIPFSCFGLVDGFKYYAALEKEKWRTHFTNVTVFLVAMMGFQFLLVFVGMGVKLEQVLKNPLIGSFTLLIPLVFIGFSMSNLLRYAAINEERTVDYKKAMFIGAALNLMGFGYVWFTYTPGHASELLFQIALIYAVSLIVRATYLMIKLNPLTTELSYRDFGGYLKFGIPLYLISFIALINRHIDQGVISNLAPEMYADYSVGAKEIPLLSFISTAVYQSQFPELVKRVKANKISQAFEMWMNSTVKVSYILYPLILVLMIVSEPLIVGVFGERYAPGVPVFRGYLLILLWRNNYYGAILSAAGKTKWITVYGFASMLSNVVLSYVLFMWVGMIGVVYATIVSVTVSNTLQLWHENMLGQFFKTYIKNPALLLLVIGIIVAYFAF